MLDSKRSLEHFEYVLLCISTTIAQPDKLPLGLLAQKTSTKMATVIATTSDETLLFLGDTVNYLDVYRILHSVSDKTSTEYVI